MRVIHLGLFSALALTSLACEKKDEPPVERAIEEDGAGEDESVGEGTEEGEETVAATKTNAASAGIPMPSAALIAEARALKCSQKDEMFGCVNAKGEIVIPYKYMEFSGFKSTGIAAVTNTKATSQDDAFVYINARDEVVFKAVVFDTAHDSPSEGLIRFQHEGKIGFMDENFSTVIAPRYDNALRFRDGKAKVCIGCDPRIWDKDKPADLKEGGEIFWIDKEGNKVASP